MTYLNDTIKNSKIKIVSLPFRGKPYILEIDNEWNEEFWEINQGTYRFYINEKILIHSNYYLCYVKTLKRLAWRYIYDDKNNQTLTNSPYYVPDNAFIVKMLDTDYVNYQKKVDVDHNILEKLPYFLSSASRLPRIFCEEMTRLTICNKCCVKKEWIKLDFY